METLLPSSILTLSAFLAPVGWGCSTGEEPAASVETLVGSEPAPEAEPAGEPRAEGFDQEHALFTGILAEHVRGGGFDYGALTKDRADLDAYIELLVAVTPEKLASWERDQRYAFWINAYNAFTIQKVIDNYPLKSIRKLDKNLGITTVFEQSFIPMNAHNPDGKGELSLNDIEHKILRPGFEDARVHAAINCASASCPPLRAEAFVASRLDAQLDEQMRLFVRDHKRNRLDRRKDRLRLSEIFKWFKEDFEKDAGSVRAYLKLWLPAEEHEFVDDAKLEYLDYDWSLNDVED